MPRSCRHQQVISSVLNIKPYSTDYTTRTDFFGNHVSYFSIKQPHKEFVVTATSEVRMLTNTAQLDLHQNYSWEQVRELLCCENSANTFAANELQDARQYTLNSQIVGSSQELLEYAKPSFGVDKNINDAISNLMLRIYQDFTFDSNFTTLATPLSTVLEHRRGVCQDFAHLAIGCLRSQGLAARYVSGYIETVPLPGVPKLVGADASHAWFSVFIPEQGWIDFDPTNNQIPSTQHITLGWGRDYADITPLKGVMFGGQQHELEVSVNVECLET